MLDSIFVIVMFCRLFINIDSQKIVMAKKSFVLVKLTSTADTGYFYVKKKNPRTQTEKMRFRKYDPRVRKHVEFVEEKLKS